MLGVIAAVLVGGVLAVSAYLYTKLRRPAGFPPGPPAYPIFGSLLSLNTDFSGDDGAFQFQLEVKRLAEKYGPVFSMAFGHSWVVIISDYALMREAFVNLGTAIAGRPYPGNIIKAWNPHAPSSMSVSDGTYDEQWKLQHHTVVQVVKRLGIGRSIIEGHIKKEAEIMIDNIRSLKKPFNFNDHVGNAVANVIMSVLFGERYDYDNEEFKRFQHFLGLGFEGMQKTIGVTKVPGVSLLPSYKKNEKALFDAYKVVNEFFYKKIAENPPDETTDEPKNFIQGYQAERKKNPMIEDKLFPVLSDFVQAGMEPITTTMGWAILFMITYPVIQKKVQEELDRVVGRNRKPNFSDRASLPYTMATIEEIFRLGTTVPMTVPHSTIRTCEVAGYTLPKNTEVWADIMGEMRNPKIWPEPLVFKPERFLDDEGQFQHREELIAFGIGRRTCLGEQLARQELFIFFSNLLHSFTFTPPDGPMEPITKGVIALTHKPPEYKVIATDRN